MQIKFVKHNDSTLYVNDSSEWRLAKDGLEGFSSFEANVTTTDDYSRDGGTTDHVRLPIKERTIKICNVDWRNSDIKRKNILDFFNYNTDYQIYITQGNQTRWGIGRLYRMAIPEPTNQDYMLTCQMSFQFENPYLMSVEDFGKDIASVIPHFGFPWISQIDKGTYVGVFNFNREVVLQNDGNNVAYPYIKIGFINDVTNPKVMINEGFVRIIGTFTETDNIEIDYRVNPPRVTNNGENILGMCDRASDFDHMLLQVGENTLSYDADNGTDEMSVSAFYHRLYTGI